jgi:D-3-phosphoglycerate dehydrogenase
MGKAFAKKLNGFDCNVIAYDKYKTDFTDNYVQEVDLQTLKKESDVISIHLPLTKETKYFINDSFITTCQKQFYLINTARGNHVQTSALVNGLKNKTVLGACLDVLEYETKSFETINSNDLPEDFNYLCASDKVILSPHVAGWTVESYLKLSSFLADKVENTYFK